MGDDRTAERARASSRPRTRSSSATIPAELGVLGLAVPEELGGAGGGLVDQAVAMEECGAALLPGPLLGSVAAHREHLAALVLDTAVPSRPLTVATG